MIFTGYKVTLYHPYIPNFLLFFMKKSLQCQWGMQGLMSCKETGGLAVVLLHDLDEVKHLVAVANLVVVPRNDLDELVGEVNTGIGVKD